MTPRQMGQLRAFITNNVRTPFARDFRAWNKNDKGEFLFPFHDVGLPRQEHLGHAALRRTFVYDAPGMYALMLGVNDYELRTRYQLLPRVRHDTPLTGETLVRAKAASDAAHEALWDDFCQGVLRPIETTPEDAYFAMGYRDSQWFFRWEKWPPYLSFETVRKARLIESDKINVAFAARARLLGNPVVTAWMERYPLPKPSAIQAKQSEEVSGQPGQSDSPARHCQVSGGWRAPPIQDKVSLLNNFEAADASLGLPGKHMCANFCAMAGSRHPVPGRGEVLTDRTEAGKKRLSQAGIAKALHLALAPTRGLVTVFRAVIDPGRRYLRIDVSRRPVRVSLPSPPDSYAVVR